MKNVTKSKFTMKVLSGNILRYVKELLFFVWIQYKNLSDFPLFFYL